MDVKRKILAFILAFSLSLTTVGSAICLKKQNSVDVFKLTPVYRTKRSDNVVALSFDAAWGTDETMKILSVLDKYSVKATFFLVAFWAEKNPELVRTIVASGHEIGTHSSTHPHFNSLSPDEKKDELLSSIRRISAISETKIEYFRPPFGEYDDSLITVCSEMKLTPVQWDVDTLDWKGLSAKEITDRVMKTARSGSIILCHNDGEHTAEAIDSFIPMLIGKGFTVTTVGNTVLKGQYTIDQKGEQSQ